MDTLKSSNQPLFPSLFLCSFADITGTFRDSFLVVARFFLSCHYQIELTGVHRPKCEFGMKISSSYEVPNEVSRVSSLGEWYTSTIIYTSCSKHRTLEIPVIQNGSGSHWVFFLSCLLPQKDDCGRCFFGLKLRYLSEEAVRGSVDSEI
jgi:hypothetical protein